MVSSVAGYEVRGRVNKLRRYSRFLVLGCQFPTAQVSTGAVRACVVCAFRLHLIRRWLVTLSWKEAVVFANLIGIVLLSNLRVEIW